MAISFFPLLLLVAFFCLAVSPRESLDVNPSFSFFSFERFDRNQSSGSEIALYGGAEITDSVVILSSGRAAYKEAIKLTGRNPGFSTNFSFSITPGEGGGLSFFLVPSGVPLESINGYLANSVVAVEFVVSMDPKTSNQSGNLIEIHVGSEDLIKSSDLSGENLVLGSREKLHSWIDYDGGSKGIEVRLSKSSAARPLNSLLSYPIDLSIELWREAMIVGMSSLSANSSLNSSIHSWSFAAEQGAPYLMHSEPLDPNPSLPRQRESPPNSPIRPKTYPRGVLLAIVLVAACGALVTLFVVFVWIAVVARRPVAVSPVEYPVHPVEAGREKIVLVGEKGEDSDKK